MGKYNKRILTSTEKEVKSFLRGFFDAEGCIFFGKETKRKFKYNPISITISNKDVDILEDIRQLLFRLGIFSLKPKKQINDYGYCYVIVIKRLDSIKRFIEEIGSKHVNKKALMDKSLEYINTKQKYWGKDTLLTLEPVTKIENVDGMLTYEITVPETERYIANGFLVHNSFTAKFRAGYSRREMLPVRTREFTEHFALIDYLASKYNIAFLLTCQVIGAPDPGQTLGIKMITGDSFYPVGGNYLLHSMTTWVSLQQIKSELYKAMLFDSSYLPRNSCEFMLTKRGLSDGIK